ncbi:lipopolysaccharide assembly protein LapB [Pleionea sp. CnH1-48]|uniref:tetratricopeptide repeat protein n=1 Tax=Pleionea sp. CnH1-48 TaxID=2954494 RepID=UPI0020980809|nr:hypothetical protein [Pleionea sp. CnH1-48]MCO7223237.1 hypothetical protein [Pleionea sp. CnH1-48]
MKLPSLSKELFNNKGFRAFIIGASIGLSCTVKADIFEQNVSSTDDLEWGNVLFEYYQKDYFNALIEYEYAHAISNPTANSEFGQLVKGGMMLSYGLADESHSVFQSLLNKDNLEPQVRNSAWYYLANLHYHKSDIPNASEAMQKIAGEVPEHLHTDYHYLATLINNAGNHLAGTEQILDSLSVEHPNYAYVLFNFAISQFKAGNVESAAQHLQSVAALSRSNEELSLLADRARHGLAQIAIQQGDMLTAWNYLTSISTTGLYSNRALLTYAWTAIKLKQFNLAIAALQILNERSIAIPEVQEAKVLLAHLYEQEGSPRKALKSNLLAIEAFNEGLKDIQEAREIIAMQDVPKEFITNFDAVVGQTDWYATEPTIDYRKLTPFVVDLIASHAFSETLRELSDLYAIQQNLEYWSIQAEEHLLILKNSNKKTFGKKQRKLIAQSEKLKQRLQDQKADLKLYALTLPEEEQKRLKALVESTSRELNLLNSRLEQLKNVKEPYRPPASYKPMVAEHHERIKQQLRLAQSNITVLEPVVRSLVNEELSKHEDRMKYYLAQSRLAKARLYDTTLMTLDKAKSKKVKKTDGEEG